MGRKSKQKQQRRTGRDVQIAASRSPRKATVAVPLRNFLPKVTAGRTVGFLLVASALLQGMFFSEQRVAGAAIILVVGTWWFLTHRRESDWDWLESLLFALATVAVLSVLWAASREDAVLAMAVWAPAFVVYTVVRRERGTFGHDLVDGALAGATLLLLVGAAESVHFINILQWNLVGRLTLGLQYPDTAGALAFGLAWMALWRLGTVTGRRWQAALLALASGMVMAGLLTVSRGALLALLVGAVLGLTFTGRDEMGRSLRRGLLVFLAGAVGYEIAVKVAFIPGLILAALLAVGLEEGVRRLLRNRQSVLVLVGGFLLILIAFAVSRASQPIPLSSTTPLKVAEAAGTRQVTVSLSGSGTAILLAIAENAYGTPTTDQSQIETVTAHKLVTLSFMPIPKGTVSEFVEAQLVKGTVSVTNVRPASVLLPVSRVLPTSVANRFVDIAPNNVAIWQRVLFVSDAFKLWALQPVLGWGGGGWTATYRTTQAFNYTSAQTHGSFTDILTSYGIVGGVLYLGFLALACMGVLKAQKGVPGRGFAVAGIATLLIHSQIDFDFAYLAMVLLTIAWLAVLNGPPGKPIWRPDGRYLALASGLLALVMAASVVAHAEQNAALAAQRAKNSSQAVSDLSTALTFAPYDTTLWNDLATVQAGAGSSAAAQVQADVAQALANAPHDPGQAQALASQLLAVGATSQGLALAKHVVLQAPHWATAYATVAQADLFIGDGSYTHGQLKAAKLSFIAGAAALAKFNRIYASESAIPTSVNIGPDTAFILTQGELAALLSQVPLATSSLTQVASADPAQAPVADGWLFALGTVSGGVPNMSALKAGWSVAGGLTASEVSAIENAIRVLKPVKA